MLPNRKAVRLVEEGGEVWEVVTESGERFGARAVVSSLPPWQLRRLERPPTLSGAWISWNASPIIGIHLWLREPLLEEPLIGLLGTEIHWVFNKTRLWAHAPKNTGSEADGQYLSLVISGAARHILKSPTELREMACRDLALCFPGFKKAMISTWSVTKEPFATPSPVPGSDAWRPDPAVPVGNFYYVGDWTQTGLPATIESAVASGHACAQAILSRAGSADGSASGARAGRSSRGELHD
ncbi:MAG: FAD-dependent oxidoreductase [Elusimicrobia bacterium]|nr:FAD-dependent oxidoreductase [Elusimicrobiota bacterium]